MKRYRLDIYLPAESVNTMLEALHEAGAGIVGKYSHVAAITQMEGIWLAEEGANPHVGAVGKLCRTAEVKLTTRCPEHALPNVLHAIRSVHPYEEPVVDVTELLAYSVS